MPSLTRTDDATHPTSGTRLIGPPAACAAIFVAIALARIIYVSLYASAIPFWDQWDELNLLFRPWNDGTWHLAQLFSAHNEHRIALTRLLGLVLFVANDHVFDNLVECYANALLYAGMWALAFALFTRNQKSHLSHWVLALVVIVLGALPFDWENILVGFQSQFYLMEMAAIGTVGIATYRTLSPTTLIVLACATITSLFTMAAGVLVAPAVCCVMALLAWRDRTNLHPKIVTIGVMLVITILGLLAIPHVPLDAPLAASGLVEHVRAMLVALTWPWQPLEHRGLLFAAVVWAPTALWCWRFIRTTQASDSEIFTVGICAWVLLQFLAIAHARGHDIQSIPSRYSEIAAIGIACNAWLALRLTGNIQRMPLLVSAAVAIGLALTGYVLYKRTPTDHDAMVQRHRFGTIEAWQVRNALSGHALATPTPGSLEIPYPDSDLLQHFLSLQDMRAILPSVLLPATGPRGEPLSRLSASLQQTVRQWWGASHDDPLAHFSPVAPSTQEAASGGFCALDLISPGASFSEQAEAMAHRGDLIQLTGWYADSKRAAPPTLSIILVGASRSYAIPASTNILRPDVAKALNSHAAEHAGYTVAATLESVETGVYRVVLASNVSASGSMCDSKRKLLVLPGS